MRLLPWLVLLIVALVLPAVSPAMPMSVQIPLSPDLEVDGAGDPAIPPGASDASGTATVQFDPDVPADGLSFELDLQNITTPILQAHIHNAPAGVNGPIVAFFIEFCPIAPNGCDAGNNQIFGDQLLLSGDATPVQGTSIEDLIDAIMAGQAYVNVHTEAFLGGELRGNFEASVPEPGALVLAALSLAFVGALRGRRS